MLSIIRGTTRFDRSCLPSKTCSAYPLLHLTRATCCPSRSNTSLCSDSLLRSVPCNGSRWQRFQSVTPPSCCLSRKESPSRHFLYDAMLSHFFLLCKHFFHARPLPILSKPIESIPTASTDTRRRNTSPAAQSALRRPTAARPNPASPAGCALPATG